MLDRAYFPRLALGALAALVAAAGSGCIIVTPPDGTNDELVCNGVGPDADGDCVTNAYDNCWDVENADQLDGDADGRGDACDVVIVARDTISFTASRDGAPFKRTLASVENNSEEPMLWRVQRVTAPSVERSAFELPEDRIFLSAYDGEVSRGEALELKAMVDPSLPAGIYHASFLLMTDGGDSWPVDLRAEIVDVAPDECLFDIEMVEASLARAQQSEQRLELELTAGVMGSDSTWGPRSFDDGLVHGIDMELGAVLLAWGERLSVPVHIETDERDPSAGYGADDLGSVDVTLDLQCGAKNARRATVHDSAGAQIDVLVAATER